MADEGLMMLDTVPINELCNERMAESPPSVLVRSVCWPMLRFLRSSVITSL